jgi:hypothetical protein
VEQNTNKYLIVADATITNSTYIISTRPIYNDVELLLRYVISETHLELFKRC